MAIPIIGQGAKVETRAEPNVLPAPEVDLPPVDQAPEATAVVDDQRAIQLLGHSSSLIRGLAIERLMRGPTRKNHGDALVPLLEDPEPSVAAAALRGLEELEHGAAIEAVARKFREGSGELAGIAARTLAKLGGDRLVEEVKKRSRLDGAAYVSTMTAVARTEAPSALEYLSKAMTRAGAMPPERRAALYSAALLSGGADVSSRVVGMAISDSRSESGEPTPARIAIVALSGLSPSMAAIEMSEPVLSGAQAAVENAAGWIDGEEKTGLADTIRKKQFSTTLSSLLPFLEREVPQGVSDDQASVLRRRRGALKAILDQRDAIAQLKAEAAAIFVTAAVSSVELIGLASARFEESNALAVVARILETDVASLLALSPQDLAARFTAEGERKMRQIAGALSNERLIGGETLKRFFGALVEAGGGALLFDAAGSSKQEGFAQAVLEALSDRAKQAEPVVREVLERRPLEDAPARFALIVAARLGTQRLALVMGRRFYELRKAARFALVEAIVQSPDQRLLPLVESRAFAGEPEELAYVVLSLLADRPVEGKLAEALKRVEEGPIATGVGETESGIRLPLKCKRCEEVLIYEPKRIYVDPKSEAQDGDPAFVGEVKCKACGALDTLSPTPAAVQLMSESMMRLLEAARGGMVDSPRVMPRMIRTGGKEIGLSAALRDADRAVEASSDSIRARLRRARLRLILWRSAAKDDAEHVLSLDPKSPEALMLLGGSAAQRSELDDAKAKLAEAWRLLKDPNDEPRLYEADKKGLIEEVEDALLELEDLDVVMPEDLDLGSARDRRRQAEEAHAAKMEELEMKMRLEAGQAQRAARARATAARPAFLRK